MALFWSIWPPQWLSIRLTPQCHNNYLSVSSKGLLSFVLYQISRSTMPRIQPDGLISTMLLVWPVHHYSKVQFWLQLSYCVYISTHTKIGTHKKASVTCTIQMKVNCWLWLWTNSQWQCALVCIRLQLQNTEDESRGTTQTCTVRTKEQSQRSSRTTWSKLTNLRAKLHFREGGTATQVDNL